MRGIKITFVILGCLFLSACASHNVSTGDNASSPLNPQLNEQVIMVPVDAAAAVSLQVTIMKPPGPGPFPLAILNHGKSIGDARDEPRYRSAYLARYFVSRGFEVAMPMLRGFAGSDGEIIVRGCDAEDEGLRQAHDLSTVIDYMKQQPDIDPDRIVIAGQSYGGWTTLALGTYNIFGVKGLMNFAGGRSVALTFCPSMQWDLYTGAGHYGAQSHAPSIWFYGDNDSLFSRKTWRLMYQRYTAAGGQAQLVAYGTFLNDAHSLLSRVEGLPIWIPKADAFLARIGLPHQNLYPELLPAPYPAPSHYAAIDDVNKVPYLNVYGRQSYHDFLKAERPRVFVVAQDGTCVAWHGGYDPLARAIEECRQAGHICQPYAIDDKVVWQK